MVLRNSDYRDLSFEENKKLFCGDRLLAEYWTEKYSFENNVLKEELDRNV